MHSPEVGKPLSQLFVDEALLHEVINRLYCSQYCFGQCPLIFTQAPHPQVISQSGLQSPCRSLQLCILLDFFEHGTKAPCLLIDLLEFICKLHSYWRLVTLDISSGNDLPHDGHPVQPRIRRVPRGLCIDKTLSCCNTCRQVSRRTLRCLIHGEIHLSEGVHHILIMDDILRLKILKVGIHRQRLRQVSIIVHIPRTNCQ
mmetsp:Transcript_31638/g.73860  ORF Transcript_31638/g.73860 Transcript_31638/m.73860 type:complete len:200 (-) Transcript_31638:243-842(-)